MLLPDKELAGLSAEAHSFGDGLHKSIANNVRCAIRADIAKGLAEPFDAHNTYFHAKWTKVGKDVASKEERARRELELALLPDTVFVQQNPWARKTQSACRQLGKRRKGRFRRTLSLRGRFVRPHRSDRRNVHQSG